MHISTATSPELTRSKEDSLLKECPSDVTWYIFLVILISLLLLAQPDQHQSTAQKPTALIASNTVIQTNRPAETARK